MHWYRVMIRGEDFFMRLDGEIKRYGFYTTRFVEASCLEKVEQLAVNLIRNDTELRNAVLNPKNISPEIFVEEIAEVGADGVPGGQGTGFTFFLADVDA